MKKIIEFWNALPKTVRVFCYIGLSEILAEVAIELGSFEQVFLIRTLSRIINLALVFLQEAIPAIKQRLAVKK